MWDPQKEIQALVDAFVADLAQLAKRIALEQIRLAFSGAKLAALPPAPMNVASAPAASGRGGRARRGQREIEALRSKVLAAISERPGRRAEDLNMALGTKTPQIAQLLRKLVADQHVRTEGARRGTRYFPSSPSPEAHNGRRPGNTAAANAAAAAAAANAAANDAAGAEEPTS